MYNIMKPAFAKERKQHSKKSLKVVGENKQPANEVPKFDINLFALDQQYEKEGEDTGF